MEPDYSPSRSPSPVNGASEDDFVQGSSGGVAFTADGRRVPNPQGNNQHKDCPPKGDPALEAALREYQRRNVTSKETIKHLLYAEHGIKISTASITRRRKELGLQGSKGTTRAMPESTKRQLVLDQLEKHPMGGLGPRRVKEAIANDTGVHLTRDYVSEEMHQLDPDGFSKRAPTSKKKHRVALVVLGPDFEWSCDGHEKLSKLGFPIWGIRDVWSGKWLGLWVVPNNRLKVVVAYLYLSLVRELGGKCMLCRCVTATDVSIREAFSPNLPPAELPAHLFLPSIHNTTIERGWLQLRLSWGDDVHVFWAAGEGIYFEDDPEHYELARWLWPKLIQQELDKLRDKMNNHRVRKDRAKLNPSGVAPNIAYTLFRQYGADSCGLQAVDVDLVLQLMEEIGGEDLIRFVSAEYAARAEEIFATLNVPELTFHNVWNVFSSMLPLMYPE
ncbi:hypothetical protein V8D89_002296 [Ganoderma adspersum]